MKESDVVYCSNPICEKRHCARHRSRKNRNTVCIDFNEANKFKCPGYLSMTEINIIGIKYYK